MERRSTRKSKIIRHAKNKLILSFPFYASLLLKSELFFSKDVPTAATDGRDFYINEEYMNTLNPFEVTSMLMHEVLHKVFMHPLRLAGRKPRKWNISCDYVLNPIIKNTGLPIKDEWLYDKQWEGKTADYVYEHMEDEPDEDGEGGNSPDHLLKPFEDMSESDVRQLEQDIKQQVAEATATAKAAGAMPGDLEKFIGDLLAPAVDWTDTLRHLVQKAMSGRDKTTWSRLNRRFIGQDILLPSTQGEQTPPLIIMIDTSGSIYGCPQLLEKFMSEINSIVEDVSPASTHIIYTDTKVQGHEIFDQGDEVKIKLKGGGGTDFTNFFNYAIEQDIEASTIIAFSDMYAGGMPTQYDIPIIWCCYENKSPDMGVSGDVILID